MSVKAKILLADDEPSNLEILYNILADTYELKLAKESISALKILENFGSEIELILLDVVMPGMNGYELCKIIKSKESLRHIPIIFLTARSSPEDEEYGLKIGAIDYISKPYRPNAIKLKIGNHLHLREHKSLDGKEIFVIDASLSIDISNAKLTKENETIALTKKELELLKLFLHSPERIITKEEIEYALWHGENRGESSIKTLIKNIRHKIGHKRLENIKNIGYRFHKNTQKT